MPSAFWVIIILLFIGFLHGLHSSHVEEILAQHNRDDLYRRMERISFESILDHLRLFFPVLLPVFFVRFFLPESTEYVVLFFLAFLVFAISNLYLFFSGKVSLHQHDHEHLHNHGHGHDAPETGDHLSHIDHGHSLPKEMDSPVEPEDSQHHHEHEHEHIHLHIHHEGEEPQHKHKHYPGIWDRILTIRNSSIIFLLSAVIIVFSPATGAMGVMVFLSGAYLSTYLLNLIYIANGIRLMEKCISFSDLFNGLIGFVVLFLL